MQTVSSELRFFLSRYSCSPSYRRLSFSAHPVKAIDTALIKEKLFHPLAFPSIDDEATVENAESNWVIGIDPDLGGALAVLKTDEMGCRSAQVYDTPHSPVLVGKTVRKRLDATSMVQLIKTLHVPPGTRAYIEQPTLYPTDGKLARYIGGYGYGLWVGILVASDISVIPSFAMDDSRQVALELFPSLSSQLKRKKDHGRAEALLIAAHGEATSATKNYIEALDKVKISNRYSEED